MRVHTLGVGVCVCVFVRKCGGVHGRKSVGVGQKCSLQPVFNFIIEIKKIYIYNTWQNIEIDNHSRKSWKFTNSVKMSNAEFNREIFYITPFAF
jgi:hypothetical protein